MIKKPLKRPSRYDELDDTNETIKKALKITDILINNPPKDKRFLKRYDDYFLQYYLIISRVQENKHYSDDEIQRDINKLYNDIFKNRRH